MNSRRQFITLASLLLLAQFIFVGVAHYGLDQIHDQVLRNVAAADRTVAALDLARRAEARFKIQVQEWKNVLLRGDNVADRKKYLDAFEAEAAVVQDNLSQLRLMAGSVTGLEDAALAAMLTEHQQMMTTYKAALNGKDLSATATARAVDAAVRGVDRQLTRDLQALAADIAAEAESANARVSEQAIQELEQMKRTTVIELVIASSVIVLLIIVFVGVRQRAA